MANKKFYYNNRKSESRSSQSVANTEVNAVDNTAFDVEKLSLSLIELGANDVTIGLLTKFNISTASDLVRRTEKDMYKVQGLNKKVLLELRAILEKQGLSFKPEQPRPQSTEQKRLQPDTNPANGAGIPSKPTPRSRNEENRTAQDSAGANRLDRNASTNLNKFDRNQDSKLDRNASTNLNKFDRNQDSKLDRNAPTNPNKFDRNPDSRLDNRNRNSKRNENDRDARGKSNLSLQVERPKRITEPLPVDEWRKIQKGEKWGFFDGIKTVIPSMYDEVFCFKEGLASVELDEKCGFIDSENNIIVPFDYETALSFSEGFASVVKGGKCGYINKENSVVIPFQFDAATPFEDGEGKVKKDSRWGSITPDGVIRWM